MSTSTIAGKRDSPVGVWPGASKAKLLKKKDSGLGD